VYLAYSGKIRENTTLVGNPERKTTHENLGLNGRINEF
jgi:hypothetical protein